MLLILIKLCTCMKQDEQITQLTDFVKAVMEYHQKSYELLETLASTLDDK
jgi:hypothetical protein